jgi:hypothetical protein
LGKTFIGLNLRFLFGGVVVIKRKILRVVILLLLVLGSSSVLVPAAEKPYKRTVESYPMPDVTLVNQDG